MADKYYAEWSPRLLRYPTQEQLWERHTENLRKLAVSEWGQACVERFEVPEVEKAEKLFSSVLQEVEDPELRNELDMAAGRIARAYQILGFCAGHFSQDDWSSNF